MSKDEVIKVTKKLIDQGLLIEAGWTGFRMMVLPEDTPQLQVIAMRKTFFAGAQHLFFSIMSVLDPGSEPTNKDMERMALIHKELENFTSQFKEQHLN